MKSRFWQICMLATCFLLMMAVAISRDGRLFGHELGSSGTQQVDVYTLNSDGSATINTSSLSSAKGYVGTTPLEVVVRDGRILDIKPLPCAETPRFYQRATEGMIPQYIGAAVDSVSMMQVDGVTGATFSSNAIKDNIAAACAYVSSTEIHPDRVSFSFSWKWLAALVVSLMGALLPFFIINNVYRKTQLVLNVLVLGFWSGTFLSYAAMTGYVAFGLSIPASLVPLIMLVCAFIYPIFGRPNHYCTWICPFGSLQELVSAIPAPKIKLSPKTATVLNAFRQLLWAVLMFIMWLGVGFAWMDYEPFSAFIFESASWAVLAIAGVFIVLSVFITRPYCRFVCPTGSLFKVATQKIQEK